MALPKLNNPTYEMVVPSTQEKVSYRPFLVKEQKILMMAQESEDPAMMTRTVCQLVENCVGGIQDAMKLPTFDVEYMFMQLRSVSVGSEVELMMLCPDDETTKVPVSINIGDIKVSALSEHNTTVMITDKIGMTFRYPNMTDVARYAKDDMSNVEITFGIIQDCLVNVFDENNVYDEMNPKELQEFVESMTTEQFAGVQGFFDTMPKLRHEIEYENPNTKVMNKTVLEGMQSFLV
tara:strand:+ start:2384 stop:3088 length:705 start_codon:yes stop_codon:yes gene_type:complete